MTKPKNAPVEKPVVTATEAALAATEAAADTDSQEDVSVTNTGRVRMETKIKVQDFSEGGDAAPNIYDREPDVEVSETKGNSGKAIKVESFI